MVNRWWESCEVVSYDQVVYGIMGRLFAGCGQDVGRTWAGRGQDVGRTCLYYSHQYNVAIFAIYMYIRRIIS